MDIKNEIMKLRDDRRKANTEQNEIRVKYRIIPITKEAQSEMDILNYHVSVISQKIEKASIRLRTPQPGDTLKILQEKIDNIQSELENNKQKLRELHPFFENAKLLDFILTDKRMRNLTYLKSDELIDIVNTSIQVHNESSPEEMEFITNRNKKCSIYAYLSTCEDLMTDNDHLTKKYSEIKEHTESESMMNEDKPSSLSP